jgi:flagellar basal-body rod modification protein FlgD
MADTSSVALDFNTLTGYTAPTKTGAAATDMLSKDTFLNLLITQMKYQDPMNPMDNQQFIQQLASLSTVEQLRAANDNLTSLGLYQSSINNAQSVSMIGKEVKASGNSVTLDGSTGTKIYYKLDEAAASVTINISDSSGNIVRSLAQSGVDAGDQDISWNGNDSNGSPLPAGTYTYEVSAKTAGGDAVNVTTFISGLVEGVSFSSGGPQLVVNGQKVSISDIYEVSR